MLILGGVRSGKSGYAQVQAARFCRVTFVATTRRSDAEMRRKIAVHRRERPCEWKTVETLQREAGRMRRRRAVPR
jgi:adenosyl cobinamide kinase/adenosyl cobinamide phosphate guanylyltransferase